MIETNDFPPPRVSPLPVLSFYVRPSFSRREFPSGITEEHCIYVTSARVAIALALKRENVTQGDKVLVPSFHCASLVAPIRHSGADAIFYPVEPDLSVNIEKLESLMSPAVRVVVVVHYFGFPQQLRALRTLCDQKGVLMIEDCAHAPFGALGTEVLGSVGDYAVFSLMKFFPIFDGGVLRSNAGPVQPQPPSGGTLYELRAIADAVEKAVSCRRLRPLNWILRPAFAMKKRVLAAIRKRRGFRGGVGRAPDASHGGFAFDPEWMNVSMSWFSRCVFKYTDERMIVEQRRRNYQRMVRVFKQIRGVTPIFPTLPNQVVPYLIPLLIERADDVFRELKLRGVPLYRWEDMEFTSCDVAETYRGKLFQVPCHQDLRESEIQWIVRSIEEVTTLEMDRDEEVSVEVSS